MPPSTNPRERTHRGLCGAINTIRREPFAGHDGRTKDNRATIRHQRKRLLHREQATFHIDVEDRVVELFGYSAQGGVPHDAGIREHDIRHVSAYAGDIASDLLYGRRQLRITASRYEDVGAFK